MRLVTILWLTTFACSCGNGNSAFDLASPNVDMSVPGPTMLASAQTLTGCLAVDARYVYWTDQGVAGNQVLRVPVDGSSAPSVIATGGDQPGCVVVDGNGAYFTDGGRVMAVPGGGGGALPIATGQHFILRDAGRIAVAGGYVYWPTDAYGTNVDSYNGKNAVVRVSTGGGSVDVVTAELVGNPGALAVDGMSVYYSDSTGAYARTLANPSAPPVSFGMSVLHANGLVIGGTHLAMNEISGIMSGDVAVFKLDGSGRVVVDSMLASPLAVDDRGVYVKQPSGLVRLALDGSGATTLAAPQLDATHVYFSDGAAIYRIDR
jgi:hypothetical protein